MKLILISLLIVFSCASVPHKPIAENIDLSEIINRVEKDEAIPQDKKIYIASELKNAQSGLQSQSRYIIELENKLAEKDKVIESQNKKIESLSESKGRVKQMDYQFWGFIGLCILSLIGVVLYIFIKFGNIFSPAKAPSLATELIRKQAGL
jgi:hypothetical protein